MKIAIVHDYIKEIGGAERVLMCLKEMYPDADVYTAYKFSNYWGHFKNVISKWKIYESWGRKLLFLPKFISYYTVISPLFFKSFDLSKYDLVIISATGAYFPNGVKVGKKTRLVTYCHTPPRFLYGYPTATQTRYKWYFRIQSVIANHFLRLVDFELSKRPNIFIANSIEVKNRIRKYYRREATVVYPPIKKSENAIGNVKRGDYYVMVSRLVGSKNIHLAIKAADEFGFNLKIAGRPTGIYGEEMIEMIKRSKNVEYLGGVDDLKKAELYSKARAAIALEEYADFGMVAIEPQMYRTPVVVYRGGGYLESVEEGKTGVFIDELTTAAVWNGIKKIESQKWLDSSFKSVQNRFSEEVFKKEIKKILEG